MFTLLYFISGDFHTQKKIGIVKRLSDSFVNIRFKLCLIACTLFCRRIFDIAFAFILILRNNRQSIFLTKTVAYFACIVIPFFIDMTVPVINKIHIIKNDMVMNMPPVNVRA